VQPACEAGIGPFTVMIAIPDYRLSFHIIQLLALF